MVLYQGAHLGSKLTDVLNVEKVLIVEGGLIPRAELHTVSIPDGCVVLIEKTLVGPVGAVVRTLTPHFHSRKISRRSARGTKHLLQYGMDQRKKWIGNVLI